MALRSSALSPREGTSEERPSSYPENTPTTEGWWEKVLDDPSLRRLFREGPHSGGPPADLLTQLAEER